MVTETMTRKRVAFRIQLTQSAKNELVELGDRLGMPQATIMARLLKWFCDQHAVVRNFVLGFVPQDMAVSTAKAALAKLG